MCGHYFTRLRLMEMWRLTQFNKIIFHLVCLQTYIKVGFSCSRHISLWISHFRKNSDNASWGTYPTLFIISSWHVFPLFFATKSKTSIFQRLISNKNFKVHKDFHINKLPPVLICFLTLFLTKGKICAIICI